MEQTFFFILVDTKLKKTWVFSLVFKGFLNRILLSIPRTNPVGQFLAVPNPAGQFLDVPNPAGLQGSFLT